MIISKVDRAKEVAMQAFGDLRELLVTKRASAEARAELSELRTTFRNTQICPYCGCPTLQGNARHMECCAPCGSRIDKLLLLKSKIVSGQSDTAVLKQYAEELSYLLHVPYALRGSTGSVEDVKRALELAINAATNYRIELKKARAREALQHVHEKRREEILELLVKCGADPDSEETQQRIEEIYWSRYDD